MEQESSASIYWRAAKEALEVVLQGLPVMLLMGDAILCSLIILKVPYTEIDWVAYMQQVKQFISGETDYANISGGTGPLVYPAAHVYTYTGLYHLTNEGTNIARAQILFAGLYIATLTLVMLCYSHARVPLSIFPILVLSKRLHSIFILRCFNDCFAIFFLFLAIFMFQRRQWTIGAVAYSWGLGTKMSLLVSLPGVAAVLLLGRGYHGSLRLAWFMVQVQLAIGIPFIKTNWKSYLGHAFELSRRFLFKWTVNWRFVGENVFMSKVFALTLLGLHVIAIGAFIIKRWLKPARTSPLHIIKSLLSLKQPLTNQQELVTSRNVSPRFVMTTILTSNLIGLLFARSLHYQFYAYIAWSTPFLLWRSGIHPVLIYITWGIQEWAWNVYPSTSISSAIVVGSLAFTIACVYFGAREEWEEIPRGEAKNETAKR